MTRALRTMLQWTQVQLGLRAFGVRVRSEPRLVHMLLPD